jgi:chemotaxis protein MotB
MAKVPKHMSIDRLGADFTIKRSAWIVTYADIMTIILTFFILLLSMSTIAQTKYELLVQAFTGEKAGNLQEVQEDIDRVIEEQGLGGEIKTQLDVNGLTIEFSNALLFSSGEAELTERARVALAPIERHLVYSLGPQYGIVVEGYTDDVPIRNARFRSNWELSTSRAINVMERLAEAGMDRRRISVQGFADTRAATEANISTPDGRAKLTPEQLDAARAANRRVVIRVDGLNPELLQRIAEQGGWIKPPPESAKAPLNGLNGTQEMKNPMNAADGAPLDAAPTPAEQEKPTTTGDNSAKGKLKPFGKGGNKR